MKNVINKSSSMATRHPRNGRSDLSRSIYFCIYICIFYWYPPVNKVTALVALKLNAEAGLSSVLFNMWILLQMSLATPDV